MDRERDDTVSGDERRLQREAGDGTSPRGQARSLLRGDVGSGARRMRRHLRNEGAAVLGGRKSP